MTPRSAGELSWNACRAEADRLTDALNGFWLFQEGEKSDGSIDQKSGPPATSSLYVYLEHTRCGRPETRSIKVGQLLALRR